MKETEEMRKEAVAKFAAAMEKKLLYNSHKGGWRELDYKYLFRRIHEELGELEKAVDAKTKPDIVLDEAADVANFAMMIAEVAKHGE